MRFSTNMFIAMSSFLMPRNVFEANQQ